MGYRTTKSKIKVENSKTNNYTEFYYHFFRNILFISVPLVIVSGFILSSFHISATNSGSDNLTITISSSCTLSSVVNIPHSTEVYNGNYLGNIGKTTITTLCNDGNGYGVYANGYSNNEEGNTKLINAEHPEYSIDTGLATSGSISNWAMKLNNMPDDPSPTPPVIEPAYDNTYGLVPQYWTRVASRPSGTTDMDEGSSFTTTYAVYASSNQHAGTYVGQVKYALVHPNINKQTLNNLELAFGSHGVQPAYQDETGSYFAMQDMTTEICNSVSRDGEATTTQLVDTRDNKLYYVTKLNDGHCWMTQNLDFDIAANATLNSQTTDLNVAFDTSAGNYQEYLNGYTEDNGIIYYTPASSATTINFTGTTVSGWQNSNTAPYTANKTDDTGTGHASLGNYYNWTAAIASNNSSSLTQDTLSDISKNPKNSICPKGWRLPTISNQSETLPSSTNEFARINYLYNDNLTNTDIGLITQPLYFRVTGRIGSTSLEYSNWGGHWSSTISNAENSYYLSFTNNLVNPKRNSGDLKGFAFTLRCVAR